LDRPGGLRPGTMNRRCTASLMALPLLLGE
jgi:hypothetical protein